MNQETLKDFINKQVTPNDLNQFSFDKEKSELITTMGQKLVRELQSVVKQTLEETADNFANSKEWLNGGASNWVQFSFKKGAEWQAERMYSEEEVLDILYKHTEDLLAGKKVTLEEWFNQYKKK